MGPTPGNPVPVRSCKDMAQDMLRPWWWVGKKRSKVELYGIGVKSSGPCDKLAPKEDGE